MVFISEIQGGAAVGREQLHSGTELCRKVELGGLKHAMVEVKETASTRKKWFHAAIVEEIYLCTDRTATDAAGIRPPSTAMARIAHECQRGYFQNPANREGSARVDKPCVARLQLIIPPIHGAGKGMAACKSAARPQSIFAGGALLLRKKAVHEKQNDRNRHGKCPEIANRPPFPASIREFEKPREPASGVNDRVSCVNRLLMGKSRRGNASRHHRRSECIRFASFSCH